MQVRRGGVRGRAGEHFPVTDSRRVRRWAPRAPALRDSAKGAHAELVGGVRAQVALGAVIWLADLLARHRAHPLDPLLLRLFAPLQVVGRGAAPHRRDPSRLKVVGVLPD